MHSAVAEIQAITLDLDNTLWNVFPAIHRAEANSYELLRQQYPRITERYSLQGIRDLREHLMQTRPDVRHDFTELRRLVYVQMLEESGYGTDHAEELLLRFLRDRNQVELYPDVIPALRRLAEKFPLVSLSDGNSDLEYIGIRDFFTGCVFAADVGYLKPHPAGFEKACGITNTLPEQTLHIGDHPDFDVDGARKAGYQTMWIRRFNEKWEKDDFQPDYSITTMTDAVKILCE